MRIKYEIIKFLFYSNNWKINAFDKTGDCAFTPP